MIRPGAYTARQALDDTLALGRGQRLRLSFVSIGDAKKFRTALRVVKFRERQINRDAGRGYVSPWDHLRTAIFREPDGSVKMEIYKLNEQEIVPNSGGSSAQPTNIEIVDMKIRKE